MEAATKHHRSTKRIAVNALIIDRDVQKANPPTTARMMNLVNKFDLDSIGVMTVSLRVDGTYVLLDGQTRKAALDFLELGEWEVLCNVYEGLTKADEAHLFRLLNNTQRPTPVDDFRVGMTAGDVECLAIDKIITKHGLKLSACARDGGVTCVSAMRQAYKSGGLDDALGTATAAWGLRAAAVQGDIVKGLALVHETYNGTMDRPALINKLSKFQGGASGILGSARNTRNIRSASVARLCAAVIVSVYNRGRKSGGTLADL